jgi:signal peptidase II
MSWASPAGRWAFPVAILVAAIDQASKAWVVGLGLGADAGLRILGPLRVTLIENTGISYGFLQSGGDWTRWGLAGFALTVTVALALWARRADRLTAAVGLGLIMGGALGNVADRIVRGAVVDFIDARAIGFPWIFNPADAAITVGLVLLALDSLLTRAPAAGRRPG